MSWITDRVPTDMETDEDGCVVVPLYYVPVLNKRKKELSSTSSVKSIEFNGIFRPYTEIAKGDPWRSPFAKESPAAPAEPEPRKVVQIAISNEPDRPTAIYALCNDGSIFVDYPVLPNHDWLRLPPIPQP